MRYDEIAKLRLVDLTMDKEKFTILIRHSKTDQLRKGNELVIPRTANSTCPVSMLETYLRVAGIQLSDTKLLFRGITNGKQGERLRAPGGLSHTRSHELLRAKLVQLGYSPDSFGLHSLHAWGATAAANAGVSERLFKKHGRWRSEGAKDGYVEDDLDKRLSVLRSLGL